MGVGSVRLDLIKESEVALRGVNRQSQEYLALVDSIREKGVLNSITVREVKGADGAITYGLVDGLQRFNAARDAGLTEIPANIIVLSDAEVLEAQLVANVHKIQTKPAEYSKQLLRILAQNPLLTLRELAKRLSQSESWLNQRLSLTSLTEPIQKLVDENLINLSNAYALAKLPEDEQQNYVDRAVSEQPSEFVPSVNARVKEIRDAKRQGRDAKPAEFEPVMRLQKMAEIRSQYESPTLASTVCSKMGASTTEAGFRAALAWVLHLDPISIEVDREKYEQRRKELEEKKIKAKAEREARKKAQAEQVLAG